MGKNNLILLDKGDLASSSSWSGRRSFMGTENNQWSSGADVPKRDQLHFADCNNIPNNAISKKEEESGKSVRSGFELHFDN